ncbi:GNAT family N-acetyltransferase [Hymenobacter sp. UV11]|uniref:GNAT family N-acetyltransferase n=1 Tax=Hymenobacter sp. UV11 TaxID=1849735 RepID=UPI00105D23D5|nr:GNAT family N-acetyltransferase [Hymenobacter sp. UV11]TDN38231.1 acetyltransferase [Hymenobacter sp. UV11]TFZ67592.1 GNAT family N-acetyltransferase [Hymenobacter sp. UV11]
MTDSLTIRPITAADDAALARTIRDTLTEFGAAKPGTAYYDTATDHLHELFSQTPRSAYFVAEVNGEVLGGGGIFPTQGLPANTVELVKLYLLPPARGRGVGKALINKCLEAARTNGYARVYLETTDELTQAIPLYERLGFTYLTNSLGDSGHFGCQIWMIRSV